MDRISPVLPHTYNPLSTWAYKTRITHTMLAIYVMVTATAIVGCSGLDQAQPSQPPAMSHMISDVTSDQVISAASRAVATQFAAYEVDRQQGTITTAWEQFDTRDTTGQLRDLAAPIKRMRHRAIITTRAIDDSWRVSVRVEQQRLDTTDARMHYQQQQFEDRPSYSPIETYSPANPGDEQVWTDVGRNRRMERTILRSIEAHIADDTTEADSSQ